MHVFIFCRCMLVCSPETVYVKKNTICTVGPLIIESSLVKNRVSTRTLEALDNPLVVQAKLESTVEFLYVDYT